MGFTLTEILEATGGELLQDSARRRVKGVTTDTRRIRKGELYVAIKGDHFDGHNFLSQAVAGGATALLVSRLDIKLPAGIAVVRVDDTVKAYGLIARYHRRRFNIPVVAITGSAGKTTTKELVADVLKTKYKVLFNQGTENNHIGVPATLLKMLPSHDVAVIEMGTNHPGEIAWLASIVEATVAVFTNIGPSHLAGLGSPEGVFKEKAALIDHLPKEGTVILNADDAWLAGLQKRSLTQKVYSYGVEKKADLQASKIETNARKISFLAGGQSFELDTPSWANVYNALAAIACGQLLEVPMEEIWRGLTKFRPPTGRQVVRRLKGITIIDDTYNANPLSFRNALVTLKNMKGKGRSIVIGADMLELGVAAERLHREVGAIAAQMGVDVVWGCGTWARLMVEEAKSRQPATEARHFDQPASVLEALKGLIRPGDVVLVKGSRGMKMESVVQGLIEYWKG